MRSTFRLLPYINRQKTKADGTTAIMCRITIDGRSSAISTGIYCKPEEWNAKKGIITNTRENNRLMAFIEKARTAYDKVRAKHGVVSVELLKNALANGDGETKCLLALGEEEIVHRRERYKQGTIYVSVARQRNLADFVHSRFGKEDIPITDVTESFGKEYKVYLLRDRQRKNDYTNHCMAWLSHLMNIAVDKGMIRYNPIEGIPYEKRATPKLKHIGKADLKRLMATPMAFDQTELARRLFIFSSLTGLAFADVMELRPCDIGSNVDGKRFIRKRRKKSDVEAFVPLHPIAERILSLYNTEDYTKPVFPQITYRKVLSEMHTIGIALGIRTDLGFHAARHTFGVLTLSEGISIESISKMMGHTNISSTQVYAKVTERKISGDMDRLIEKGKRKKLQELGLWKEE